MGYSVKMLRQMYERYTPGEKLRPIFGAIDRHLFQQLEVLPDQNLPKLNPLQLLEERQQLFRLAEGKYSYLAQNVGSQNPLNI